MSIILHSDGLLGNIAGTVYGGQVTFNHSMRRIKDPKILLDFYNPVLGMRVCASLTLQA